MLPSSNRKRWSWLLPALAGVLFATPIVVVLTRLWWPRWALLPAERTQPSPLTAEEEKEFVVWRGAQNDDAHLLLMWTGWFKQPGFHREYGPDKPHFCPKTCLLENRRQFLPLAKGVVFHARDVELRDLPPRDVNGRQPWVLMSQEPPTLDEWTIFQPDILRLFDYSMTHHFSSDFPIPYLPKDLSGIATAPLKTPLHQKVAEAPVVWIQSNCHASNGREAYIRELMRYIPVHSYGHCLRNREWPKWSDFGRPSDELVPRVDLMSMYRFTINVENSDCDDYWSEKYFEGLMSTAVPIVNGPRHKYLPIVPHPDAVIYIDEHTPAQLADLLGQLSQNDTAYLAKLTFRHGISAAPGQPQPLSDLFVRVANHTDHMHSGLCAFCMQVHDEAEAERRYFQKPRDIVADFDRRPGLAWPFNPLRGTAMRPDLSCEYGRLAQLAVSSDAVPESLRSIRPWRLRWIMLGILAGPFVYVISRTALGRRLTLLVRKLVPRYSSV